MSNTLDDLVENLLFKREGLHATVMVKQGNQNRVVLQLYVVSLTLLCHSLKLKSIAFFKFSLPTFEQLLFYRMP